MRYKIVLLILVGMVILSTILFVLKLMRELPEDGYKVAKDKTFTTHLFGLFVILLLGFSWTGLCVAGCTTNTSYIFVLAFVGAIAFTVWYYSSTPD